MQPCGVKFFGMDEVKTQSNITSSDCKTLNPRFTLDVSKQSEKLVSSVVEMQIKANFAENVPANTRAFVFENERNCFGVFTKISKTKM